MLADLPGCMPEAAKMGIKSLTRGAGNTFAQAVFRVQAKVVWLRAEGCPKLAENKH